MSKDFDNIDLEEAKADRSELVTTSIKEQTIISLEEVDLLTPYGHRNGAMRAELQPILEKTGAKFTLPIMPGSKTASVDVAAPVQTPPQEKLNIIVKGS